MDNAGKAFLGACLLDPKIVDQARSLVKAEMFKSTRESVIWDAILKVRETGIPDIVSVSAFLAKGSVVDKAAESDVYELPNFCTATTNWETYLDSVRESYLSSQLRIAADEIKLLSDSKGRMGEAFSNAHVRLNDLLGSIPESGALATYSQLGKEVLRDLEEGQLHKGRLRGISYGFAELDAATQGMRPKSMIVIGGRTSEGKSVLLMQFAEEAAKHGPALICTNEMGGTDYYERSLSHHTKIPLSTIQSFGIDYEIEIPIIRRTMEQLDGLPISVHEGITTVEGVISSAERVRRELGSLSWIGVDWFQMFEKTKRYGGRTEELDDIVRGIRKIAIDYKCPVVLVVQYDKASAFGDKAEVESVRGSALPAMLSDVFIMIERKTDKVDSGFKVELKIAKNRKGPLVSVTVWFDSQHTRFTAMPKVVEV